jgi:N-acyl-L-homoserine lactone synthetase
MKILKEVEGKLNNGEIKKIILGHPNSEEELDEIFKFRLKVYMKKGYIKPDHYKDGRDFDEYDEDKKTVYFIAKCENRLIGHARLIFGHPLPTVKECFSFEEPTSIKKIPPEKRAEIGRLIAVKYDKGIYFQRHFVMLNLFDIMLKYFKQVGVEGGYCFIKNKLKKKLENLDFPFHSIKDAKQIYQGKTLENYFKDKNDKVWPIYFITDEILGYLNKNKSKNENRLNTIGVNDNN